MHLVVNLIAGIALAFLGSQGLMWWMTRRARGRAAPPTPALDSGLDPAARRVYYFFAPHCGPCRAMTPVVDRLRQQHPNLFKIDVAAEAQLARGFGVRATPSLVVVENGVIQQVRIGAQSEGRIAQLLHKG